MPLKLSAGLTKKVGLPNYSSLGAACHVELELDSGLLQSPDALQAQVALAYDVCRLAVETELARAPIEPGNADAPASGQAEAVLLATDRQLAYVRQLAGEVSGIGAVRFEALVEQRLGKKLAELSLREASRLIERLRRVKSGLMPLPALLEPPLG
jgi:hypothetical protein